jgi:hypothetical protein
MGCTGDVPGVYGGCTGGVQVVFQVCLLWFIGCERRGETLGEGTRATDLIGHSGSVSAVGVGGDNGNTAAGRCRLAPDSPRFDLRLTSS